MFQNKNGLNLNVRYVERGANIFDVDTPFGKVLALLVIASLVFSFIAFLFLLLKKTNELTKNYFYTPIISFIVLIIYTIIFCGFTSVVYKAGSKDQWIYTWHLNWLYYFIIAIHITTIVFALLLKNKKADETISKPLSDSLNKSIIKETEPETAPTAVSSSIICPKCGNQNSQDSSFCGRCGTKLIPDNTLICHKCGKHNPPNFKYCIGCGTLLINPSDSELINPVSYPTNVSVAKSTNNTITDSTVNSNLPNNNFVATDNAAPPTQRIQSAPGNDEWLCTICGRVNKNYVGTCGCGQKKDGSVTAAVTSASNRQESQVLSDGQWECFKCHKINPKIVTKCLQCGERKQG